MKIYIYSREKEIQEITKNDLVDVITGKDNADCEVQAEDLYPSDDYYWSYEVVL